MTLRCAWCHDDLAAEPHVTCAGCATHVHGSCRDGACFTPGCRTSWPSPEAGMDPSLRGALQGMGFLASAGLLFGLLTLLTGRSSLQGGPPPGWTIRPGQEVR